MNMADKSLSLSLSFEEPKVDIGLLIDPIIQEGQIENRIDE